MADIVSFGKPYDLGKSHFDSVYRIGSLGKVEEEKNFI